MGNGLTRMSLEDDNKYFRYAKKIGHQNGSGAYTAGYIRTQSTGADNFRGMTHVITMHITMPSPKGN